MNYLLILPLLLSALPVWAAMDARALDVTAERLEIDQKAGHAVFIGRVRAVRGDLTLTAARADVHYGTGGRGIESIVADGAVVITRAGTPPDEARGAHGVFTPGDGKLVLTGGDVVLNRGGQVLHGTRLDYDVNGQKALLQGGGAGVKGHFEPERK
jgi:lipopolysaccharide export system protein LptA